MPYKTCPECGGLKEHFGKACEGCLGTGEVFDYNNDNNQKDYTESEWSSDNNTSLQDNNTETNNTYDDYDDYSDSGGDDDDYDSDDDDSSYSHQTYSSNSYPERKTSGCAVTAIIAAFMGVASIVYMHNDGAEFVRRPKHRSSWHRYTRPEPKPKPTPQNTDETTLVLGSNNPLASKLQKNTITVVEDANKNQIVIMPFGFYAALIGSANNSPHPLLRDKYHNTKDWCDAVTSQILDLPVGHYLSYETSDCFGPKTPIDVIESYNSYVAVPKNRITSIYQEKFLEGGKILQMKNKEYTVDKGNPLRLNIVYNISSRPFHFVEIDLIGQGMDCDIANTVLVDREQKLSIEGP